MKVFLSHASESKALVRRLTEPLPQHVSVWLDRDAMASGQRFGPRIQSAIGRECDFVLVFVDEHAVASDWVQREVQLSLQRQVALQRTYLIPVLLREVDQGLKRLGLDPEETLYLDATDLSDAGIAASGARIAEELFKHCSMLVETLRSADRRQLLEDWSTELGEFQQAAFRWQASMSHSLAVLSTRQEAFDQVRDTLADYNRVADRFIPRLPLYRDRITSAWHDRRSLCDDVRELIASVEVDVYRGAMFRLNEVLATLQRLASSGGVPADQIAPLDAEKDALNATARAALERMSAASAELVGDLERELED